MRFIDVIADTLFALPRDVLTAEPVGTGGAVGVRLAHGRLRVGDVDADSVARGGLHHLLRRGLRDAVDGLDGDLQAIDQPYGFAAVEAAVGHRVHDLHEGMLDAAGVFDGGETDGPFVVAEAVAGVVVELAVVVAVGPAL